MKKLFIPALLAAISFSATSGALSTFELNFATAQRCEMVLGKTAPKSRAYKEYKEVVSNIANARMINYKGYSNRMLIDLQDPIIGMQLNASASDCKEFARDLNLFTDHNGEYKKAVKITTEKRKRPVVIDQPLGV